MLERAFVAYGKLSFKYKNYEELSLLEREFFFLCFLLEYIK